VLRVWTGQFSAISGFIPPVLGTKHREALIPARLPLGEGRSLHTPIPAATSSTNESPSWRTMATFAVFRPRRIIRRKYWLRHSLRCAPSPGPLPPAEAHHRTALFGDVIPSAVDCRIVFPLLARGLAEFRDRRTQSIQQLQQVTSSSARPWSQGNEKVRVGMEANGFSRWFERLLALGNEIRQRSQI
jgi:hypothetical protein